MIEVRDENGLTKQIKGKRKVAALFFASWCPFCRSFMSIFNKHAEKQGDTVFIKVKIDEDENPLWETYQLNAVPSVIFFVDGQVSKRLDCKLGVGLNDHMFSQWLGTK